MRRQDRDERRRGKTGFTLVELLVVIAIIGLIISLVLVAGADGVRRAEERATQSLIIKLETGIGDRLDALLNAQAPVNQTHRYLASINYLFGGQYIPVGATTGSGSDERRAQTIARYDYIRAELPDVFFLNSGTSNGAAFSSSYPLNFAASPYPTGGTTAANYFLPLGYYAPGLPVVSTTPSNTLTTPATPSSVAIPASHVPPPITGIFGASFSAIGGITKNLGYTQQGYDGVDNNGNNLIDEMAEGTPAGMTPAAFATQVNAQLAKHTHKTARAEMLYAILVEGVGPLGSVFTRDEFTAREVLDTDGDGLPEFIDAWGEPLQFFRWPVYFGTVAGSSDTQKGSNPYLGYSDTRELDPLDANQLLVSPGWWALVGNPAFTSPVVSSFTAPNGAADGQSQGALAFMRHFHTLVEPSPTIPAAGLGWDRSGGYRRRAYQSKFLILSAGSDKEPGVAQFAKDYADLTNDSVGPNITFPNQSLTIEQNVALLNFIENQASQSDPSARTGVFYEVPNASTSTTVYLQTNAGLDDISNHNTSAPSSGVR